MLNLLRFNNSIPTKFVYNRKLCQWGRNEIIDNTISKIEELIAENERLKAKPENNPLTLEEVKSLKDGDVVWLKYNNDNYLQTIQFAEIVGEFFTYYAFGNEMLCNCYLTNIYKACKIYRNKPEGKDEQR